MESARHCRALPCMYCKRSEQSVHRPPIMRTEPNGAGLLERHQIKQEVTPHASRLYNTQCRWLIGRCHRIAQTAAVMLYRLGRAGLASPWDLDILVD